MQPPQAADDRVPSASVAGDVEGCRSLALVVLPFLGPSADHPGNPIGSANHISIAFGLAAGGVRFDRGGGRLAARVALGVLSLWFLVVLAASVLRWEQVLWSWRR